MKLNRVESIAFDQSQNILNRRINQDCDPRNFRRQREDPVFLARQVQKTLRPPVEVESKSIGITCNRGHRLMLVFDTANFYVDALKRISKEALHVQRVT